MDTISKQGLGNFALGFLDNLMKVDENEGKEREYYVAIMLVADLDEEGDVRVALQSTSENGMVNVRVLQEAQFQQTLMLAGSKGE